MQLSPWENRSNLCYIVGSQLFMMYLQILPSTDYQQGSSTECDTLRHAESRRP